MAIAALPSAGYLAAATPPAGKPSPVKPELLIITPAYIPDDHMARFQDMFTVINAPQADEQRRLKDSGGLANVRAVFTLGSKGLSTAMMDAMPKLEIIVCKGAGASPAASPQPRIARAWPRGTRPRSAP